MRERLQGISEGAPITSERNALEIFSLRRVFEPGVLRQEASKPMSLSGAWYRAGSVSPSLSTSISVPQVGVDGAPCRAEQERIHRGQGDLACGREGDPLLPAGPERRRKDHHVSLQAKGAPVTSLFSRLSFAVASRVGAMSSLGGGLVSDLMSLKRKEQESLASRSDPRVSSRLLCPAGST